MKPAKKGPARSPLEKAAGEADDRLAAIDCDLGTVELALQAPGIGPAECLSVSLTLSAVRDRLGQVRVVLDAALATGGTP